MKNRHVWPAPGLHTITAVLEKEDWMKAHMPRIRPKVAALLLSASGIAATTSAGTAAHIAML